MPTSFMVTTPVTTGAVSLVCMLGNMLVMFTMPAATLLLLRSRDGVNATGDALLPALMRPLGKPTLLPRARSSCVAGYGSAGSGGL